MMGDDGGAMPRERVEEYAAERGLSFITGTEILDRWEAFRSERGEDL